MDRRGFLEGGIALGAVAALGSACDAGPGPRAPRPNEIRHSVLDGPPGNSGIDTVVVVMMENRSFDSYLGWLARDHRYLDTGRSRYGRGFHVKGRSFQSYPAPDGTIVDTYRRVEFPDPDPWRACGHPDPGHGWNSGRAQRDGGFLAEGSGNDIFALGYFEGADLPVYDALVRRFVVCDRWHASVLAPTYPNREYLLSGQSGGNKSNTFPTGDGFPWDTIVDRLVRARVSVADYATDLPPLALWGSRMTPHIRTIGDYYEDAAAGQLPAVSFLDPAFVGEARSDDHPHGDPRAAQRFVRDVFRAFATSPQWHKGLFVLTYDEWGGFFDHKAPPHLHDDLASDVDSEDFSQAGFRVPTVLASPRALPGAVDHTRYDHTAVLRFLEWRFLGAPPRGHRAPTPWYLTQRDRYSANPGELLSAEYVDPELYFDPDLNVPDPTGGCDVPAAGAVGPTEAAAPDEPTASTEATAPATATAVAAGPSTAPTASGATFMATPSEPSPWEEGLANGYWERLGLSATR